MKAINCIKEKFSKLTPALAKHKNCFYTGVFLSLIFGSILFFQSTSHELEVLKHKKENVILKQFVNDSIALVDSQRQVISNQERALGTASQIIQEQNTFIRKALEQIERFRGLFSDPDKWI